MKRTIATINLEVDLRALGQKDMTRGFEGAARLVEGLGDAASVVCRIAARVEAASPLPARRAGRIADALRDQADPHITIVDQPGLLLSVRVTATGEFGHRSHASLEAAPQLAFEPALDARGLQRVLTVTIEALK
jgi:hypothetical protein